MRTYPAVQVEARTSRHHEVGDHHLDRGILFEEADRRRDILRLRDYVLPAEGSTQSPSVYCVIVNEENTSHVNQYTSALTLLLV